MAELTARRQGQNGGGAAAGGQRCHRGQVLLVVGGQQLTAVLGIVYRVIAAHLIRKAGLTPSTAQSGAVTLIQRFGGALKRTTCQRA